MAAKGKARAAALETEAGLTRPLAGDPPATDPLATMEWPEPRVVRASLADQAGEATPSRTPDLAIALGANLPSPAGPPLATLLAVRPLLEELLSGFVAARGATVRWSPLFRTAPVGGPAGQPDYLNAAVLVSPAGPPTPAAALELLTGLQGLEQRFARRRHEHWGPRSLDLDLLWWGELRSRSEALELPHPRLLERSFVLAPLAAIDPDLLPPGADAGASTLLARLEAVGSESALERLTGCPGWPEEARTAGENSLCVQDGANA